MDIFQACRDKNLAQVQSLVKNRSNVLHKGDIHEDSPLHYACYHGNLPIVTCLIKSGANVNQINENGVTPLHHAVSNRHLDIVTFLVENGATVNFQNNRDGLTPLHHSCLNGDVEIVKLLVNHGANVNKVDYNVRTPFYQACYKGFLTIIQFLVAHGARVNQIHETEQMPLFGACLSKKVDIVKYLLENGANANAKTKHGITSLHLTCFIGELSITTLLINHGAADVNIKERDSGDTPLCQASKNGHVSIVQLLLDHGAILSIQNEDGKRANQLMSSVIKRIIDTLEVRILLALSVSGLRPRASLSILPIEIIRQTIGMLIHVKHPTTTGR